MWRLCAAIAGLTIGLSYGTSVPAMAFQEIPVPPPDASSAQAMPALPPLALGEPAIPTEPPKAEQMDVFGYTVPKLDFGLELLYGQDAQHLDLEGPPPALEDNDVSVLGKIRRRF